MSRKLLIELCLLLAAAASLNIAVAWAWVLWAPFPASNEVKARPLTWPIKPPHGWPRAPTQQFLARSSGLTASKSFALADVVSGAPPFWSLSRLESGFPMRSLVAQEVSAPDGSGSVGGVQLPRGAVQFARASDRWQRIRLPIRPIGTGFVINTLVYAFGLWFACRGFVMARARRRIAAGRCQSCGYDLSGLGGTGGPRTCQECGFRPAGRLAESQS
jgi:hypothetical protein